MNEIEKMPPQAIELEEAILGAIMLEKDAIDEVINLISPECFYKEAHQEIYKAILKLSQDNKAIDILTVTEFLKRIGKLEEIGGPYYITQLTSKVATATNIIDHALIIKEKAIQRELIHYANELIKTCYQDTDIEGMLIQANDRIEKITEFAYGQGESKSFRDLIAESLKQYEERERLAKIGKVSGIRTPLADLTRLTNGWQNGDLVIIAGRPSMGKTAFALAAAKMAVKEDKHVCIYSVEMKGVRLTDRILCGETDIDPDKYRKGGLSSNDWTKIEKSLNRLEKFKIHINDNSLINPEYVKARSRIMKKKGKCDLIIIDYLGLIDPGRFKDRNREQEVAEISRKFKILAMDLNIPVILISQLNRSCEARTDKRPHLSDLRESGALEQDADFVGFLYRPEYYGFTEDDQNNSLKGLGELIISKQRNGRVGTIEFKYNESMTRIYDLSREGEAEPIQGVADLFESAEDVKSKQYKDKDEPF